MNHFLGELNDDQLDGLANLSFDLAKASLVLVFLPFSEITTNLLISVIKMLSGLFLGLVFVYLALVLLKGKERNRKRKKI